jgi:sugar lactone lactonase YvrE
MIAVCTCGSLYECISYVCNVFNVLNLTPLQGLLRYNYYDSQSKDIVLLTTHVSASSPIDPGSQITYANDLAIASDGTIYFTSCTDIVPQLNQLGFYDTYRAWFLSLMRVRCAAAAALDVCH